MKTSRLLLSCNLACCALLIALPLQTHAVVDEQQFNALKELVDKLNQKVENQDQRIKQLEDTHARDTQVHSQDQQQHQQDQQQILDLQQKVSATQLTISNVQQRASVPATAVEPMLRQPLDEATVNHNFIIAGDAEVQFAKMRTQNPAFLFADFAPIFLYRGGDNVLFEAGFDFGLQNNAPDSPGASTTTDLSFAQLDYLMNDYVTLCAGDILLPLGTYEERSAGWLNKIPDDPLPRDLLPGSGVGAELRGAVPIGRFGKLINYSIWGVNGPSSVDGTGGADQLDLGGNVGLRSDNAIANLHGNPSGGARLGFFAPFKPHYDFELGLSGQSGEWDNAGNHLWSALVLDATLHLGAPIEIRGEYINTQYGSDSAGMVHPHGWWIQGGYKLAGLNLDVPYLSNVELVGRYDRSNDGLGTVAKRYTAGMIYYFSNTLLFEGDYEFLNSPDPTQKDQFILQLSYGF